MLFHNDKCTITRRIAQKVNNHLTYTDKVVYSDIPCHLSFSSLNSVNQTDSTALNLQTFKLYISSHLNVDVQLNDVVDVTTARGQVFKLYAGATAKYPMTIQVQLERNKIV